MFGYSSLEELPELPKYKMDENRQIVIDDLIEENKEENLENEKNDEDSLEDNATKNSGQRDDINKIEENIKIENEGKE